MHLSTRKNINIFVWGIYNLHVSSYLDCLWMDGYLRPDQFLDHLTVIKISNNVEGIIIKSILREAHVSNSCITSCNSTMRWCNKYFLVSQMQPNIFQPWSSWQILDDHLDKYLLIISLRRKGKPRCRTSLSVVVVAVTLWLSEVLQANNFVPENKDLSLQILSFELRRY